MDYDYAHRGSTDVHGHTAIASGYLFKVAHPLSRWHRRYYVLYSDGLLHSFKNDRARAANRVIPVGRLCLRMKFGEDTTFEDCRSWPKKIPQELRFSIINSDRAYHFVCESEREMEMWKRNLLGTLNKLASSNRSWASETVVNEERAPPVRPTAEENEVGRDGEAPSREMAHSPNKARDEEFPYDPASELALVREGRESDTGSIGPPLSERGSLGPALSERGSLGPALSERGSLGPALSERGSLGPALSERGSLGTHGMAVVELENANEPINTEEQLLSLDGRMETQEYLQERNKDTSDEHLMVLSDWAETLVKDTIETVFNEMTQPPEKDSEATEREVTAAEEPPAMTADIGVTRHGTSENKSHVGMPESDERVDTTQRPVDKRKSEKDEKHTDTQAVKLGEVQPLLGDKTANQPSGPKLETPSLVSVRDRIKTANQPSAPKLETPSLVSVRDRIKTANQPSAPKLETPSLVSVRDRIKTANQPSAPKSETPSLVSVRDRIKTANQPSAPKSETPSLVSVRDRIKMFSQPQKTAPADNDS